MTLVTQSHSQSKTLYEKQKKYENDSTETRLLFIGNYSNMRANQERNQKTLGLSEYAQETEYMKTVILLLNKYTANMNLKQALFAYQEKKEKEELRKHIYWDTINLFKVYGN